MPEIEILPWRRTQILASQVHPSPMRPHFLTREGPAGGVYVRVGSTNRRADAELIEELRRFARGEGFDEQPMPGLDSEALDFRAASESFGRVGQFECAAIACEGSDMTAALVRRPGESLEQLLDRLDDSLQTAWETEKPVDEIHP